jgi:hypothetical protein
MKSRTTPAPPRLSRSSALWIGCAALAAGLIATVTQYQSSKVPLTGPEILVYSDTDCRDCRQWTQYLRDHGFRARVDFDTGRAAIQTYLGVPRNLQGPVIGIVGGYVIEGHVPAEDILRLVAERPAARGLAVPGRPGRSPGMEGFSAEAKPYDVILFGESGAIRVYATH